MNLEARDVVFLPYGSMAQAVCQASVAQKGRGCQWGAGAYGDAIARAGARIAAKFAILPQ